MSTKPIPFEKRSVFDSKGECDFGGVPDDVAEAIGCKSGPVRLLNGVGQAYGLAHIERHASRVKQIEGLGYRNVLAYVRAVAANYSCIALQEDGRLVLVAELNSRYHWLVCQWDEYLNVWSVTTAIPKNSLRKLNIVWRKDAV